ncbi:MAG: sugar phosphate isomerase/epimerase family protein [Elusimicrobiota bacterium]
MQGRLVPKYRGRYQAHPVGCWQEEFQLAASQGLDLVEFILDYEGAETNPLLTERGRDEILSLSARTGVHVRTVCADYFMAAPLHGVSAEGIAKSRKGLEDLVGAAARLGATDIVIPCVDASSLNRPGGAEGLIAALEPVVPLAERMGVNLSLETDLAPAPFAALLKRFGSRRVTVNYDTGNSAALGFDPREELAAYGDRISDVHIKDRERGGGSVLLGRGDADFDRFFESLSRVGYRGPFIMQAYRDDEGVRVFQEQLRWITPKLERYGERCGIE